MIQVRRATLADLDAIVPLFDAYRQFYRLPSDLDLARTFLRERIERGESVIFVATDGDAACGFTQLYPIFSSGLCRRIYVLNDLYVSGSERRRGVGRMLLNAAADFARSEGAARLTLVTALDNHPAQGLYEASGWKRDSVFCTYHLQLV